MYDPEEAIRFRLDTGQRVGYTAASHAPRTGEYDPDAPEAGLPARIAAYVPPDYGPSWADVPPYQGTRDPARAARAAPPTMLPVIAMATSEHNYVRPDNIERFLHHGELDFSTRKDYSPRREKTISVHGQQYRVMWSLRDVCAGIDNGTIRDIRGLVIEPVPYEDLSRDERSFLHRACCQTILLVDTVARAPDWLTKAAHVIEYSSRAGGVEAAATSMRQLLRV